MNHETTYVAGHRPYAIDLGSLDVTHSPGIAGQRPYSFSRINAVWFRRRKGRNVACLGYLWDFLTPDPADPADFLTRTTTARYGGECLARWDGTGIWAPGVEYAAMIEYRDVLYHALDRFPDVPTGHDGWWTFR